MIVKKVASLLKWQLALMFLLAMALTGTAVTVSASTAAPVWDAQADFEQNASTTANATTRTTTIDTSSVSGTVRISGAKDFVTTATITCITPTKIYTTGVDRTSIKVLDPSQTLIGTIPVPKRVAGVVYNPVDRKLYVGQCDDNKVLVISELNDTVVNSITIGTGNGVYAAAYYSEGNKVYLANIADQTVSILSGEQDTLIATLPVAAGSTTAAVDLESDRVYLTDKSNSYVTVIDALTDQVVQTFDMGSVVHLLGGEATGNTGLQIDALSRGVSNADFMRLSWHNDPLQSGQKIELQGRTATEEAGLAGLDAAIYAGADGPTSWYHNSDPGNTGGYVDIPFARFAEFQLKLSYDGVNTPVVGAVDLAYFCNIGASAGPGGTITPPGDAVEHGASKTFYINANFGYHIEDVVVNGVSQGPVTSYTFQNTACGQTIAATFARNLYPITASACSGGTISPSGTVDVPFEFSQTFDIVPDTGYYITDVKVDNVSQGALASYTFENVSAPHAISACFARISYTITATAGSGGTINPSGAVAVLYGDNQQFVPQANPGYHVAELRVDGEIVPPGTLGYPSYTFVNVTGNHTISVSFAPDTFIISASAGRGGTITPSGDVVVNYGQDVRFDMTPNNGLVIKAVVVDGTQVTPAADNSYTFQNVQGGHTIHVTFQPSETARLFQAVTFNPPFGFAGAPDQSGNYFYTKYTVTHYIYGYDSAGNHTWTSSTPNSGGGHVVTDNEGNVYSHTAYFGYVYKFTPSSGTTHVWSRQLPNWSVEATGVNVMTLDNRGHLYVTQRHTSGYIHIYKLRTSDGVVVWNGQTELDWKASGIVVDSQGMVYLTGTSGGGGTRGKGIYKFDTSIPYNPSNVPSHVAVFDKIPRVTRLAIDSSDNIYGVSEGPTSTQGTVFRMDSAGNTVWSKAPYPNSLKHWLTTDSVNLYVGHGQYLYMYDLDDGTLKQTINNVPTGNYDNVGFTSTDNFGSVWVHNVYNTTYVAPLTKFELREP